jgi:hypothetical protein
MGQVNATIVMILEAQVCYNDCRICYKYNITLGSGIYTHYITDMANMYMNTSLFNHHPINMSMQLCKALLCDTKLVCLVDQEQHLYPLVALNPPPTNLLNCYLIITKSKECSWILEQIENGLIKIWDVKNIYITKCICRLKEIELN